MHSDICEQNAKFNIIEFESESEVNLLADWDAPLHWIYQNTNVDIASFSEALDAAMATLGVPKKALEKP